MKPSKDARFDWTDFLDRYRDAIIREWVNRLRTEVSFKTADLRESELKYKTLVEDITDGYVVIHEGLIVFTNRDFSTMHGYGGADLLGKSFLELISPCAQAAVLKAVGGSP